MDKRAAIVLSVIFGGLFLLFALFMVLAWYSLKGDELQLGERIAVVELRGVIGDDSPRGVDGQKTVRRLRELAKDDDVKGIVVRVDSPGGAVGPSQEIRRELRRIGEAGKKIVVSMGNVAASGGYYIATGAQEIFAEDGTVTGSIGVIGTFFMIEKLLKSWEIDASNMKAGKLKDSGTPFREMNEEDRAYLQALLDEIHQQFIEAVAEGRKLTVEEVKPIADGRVLTGRQAKELKLVDRLGNFHDAVLRCGELAGISGEPKVQWPPKEGEMRLRELLGEGARAIASELKGAAGMPPLRGFLYLAPQFAQGGP
jgi:protease-4